MKANQLITSAAYPTLCQSGHIRIVYANGEISTCLNSVPEALDQANVDLHEGRIIAEEVPELERQIKLVGQSGMRCALRLGSLLGKISLPIRTARINNRKIHPAPFSWAAHLEPPFFVLK